MLKKCEFDKDKLEAMFPKKHTLKKHVHTIHAHHSTHTHTSKLQLIQTPHARHATHTYTPSMLIFHTYIMLLYMVEYIHPLIVAERVT